ncbi:diguanylate cyclase domain-containing protein [Geodermatophilus sp. SYSU D00703]
MTGRRRNDTDTPRRASGTAVSRGPEHRVAVMTLAILTFLGGLVGCVTLMVDGAVHPGTARVWYAVVMLSCLAVSLPLAVRQRAGPWATFGVVLLGHVVYVVSVLSIEDPRHAPPLLLLFPCFVAAWFLGPWMVGVSVLMTVLSSGIALTHGPDESLVGVLVQLAITAGVLNGASLGVYVLRRRVQRLLEATQALSNLDPLTGLANRRSLVEQAPRVWRQARREGSRVAAMVLDLDHFKKLNDTHGHAAGDAVLRAVATALSATVRPSDVLARIGGEELVVLGLVSDSAEASRLAERLRGAVAGSRTPDHHAVTASIGMALVRPVDGEDAADAMWRLIDRADGAMYEAKQAGRDRVVAVLPRQRSVRLHDNHPQEGAPAGEPA